MGAFDHIPFSICLADCQQYYQKTLTYTTFPTSNSLNYGGALPAVSAATGARVGYLWRFAGDAGMRIAPVVATYSPGNAGANWWDVTSGTSVGVFTTAVSSVGVFIYSSVSTTLNDLIYIHAQADAGL